MKTPYANNAVCAKTPALGTLFPKSSQSGDRIQYYRLWPETLGLIEVIISIPTYYTIIILTESITNVFFKLLLK